MPLFSGTFAHPFIYSNAPPAEEMSGRMAEISLFSMHLSFSM